MFTKRLKSLRKEAGLTQKEIADHFKTSPQSYAQWEKGLRSPSKESLEKLAQFFNVSTDYLLGNSELKNPEDQLSNVELLFRKTSKNMTPEQKETFQKELLEFMEIRRKAFEEDDQ
ncbi:helix-turn-helix transcriptional regulator [Streptococcus cristatus]|uniref:helix-turn-helix domain-containing protein n=1 Tax=Streptococcus cristatus TaxID=45634 RepID=UPI0028D3BC1D|nr:helix-turn-helix transcriptional regulator [Streptococcus cristatus]